MWRTWVQSPGWEKPLEKAKATHSSILAWGIPWTVQPMRLQRVRHDFHIQDFPGGSDGKASVYNAGDLGLIPGSGRSPGEGNGNPLQYSCMENPVDGGAWTWGCKESDTTEQLHFLSFPFFCNTSENLRILSVRHVRQLQLTNAADPTDTLTATS